jgi:glucokinase
MKYIGIDVGGTNLAAGLVDEKYHIIYRKNVPTDRNVNAEQMVEILAALTEQVILEAGVSREEIKCIGLGVPGTANLKTGQIEYANNLPFCQGELRKELKEKTGINVYFDNDANAAAWGEYLLSEDKPESFVMVTLGTGVGCGIVLNGKLFRGVNYAAGEIGHMIVKHNGKPCPCGRRGCLELYASAQALVDRAKKKMQKREEPSRKLSKENEV